MDSFQNRQSNMEYIPGLGDYERPVENQPAPGTGMDSSQNRQSSMEYIPGIGDYKPNPGLCDYQHPVANQAVPTESNQQKFTPEAAAHILLHFGLEKEDLEHLITYPEDQLTPANLPIVLLQIRQQKDKRTSTAVQSKTSVEPSSTRMMDSAAVKFSVEPPQKEWRSSALDSPRMQSRFFTSPSSSSPSAPSSVPSQSTDQKMQIQSLPKKDTDTRDTKPGILKSILKKREPENKTTTKMQQPQPSHHGLVLSGKNEASGTADQSKSSVDDEHAVPEEQKKQTQKKEVEPAKEQEAQGQQTQLQERHSQQMSDTQYSFQPAQTMWPPVSYPVNTGPPHFYSAYYGNPHPMVPSPVQPQPTMGSVSYNYMAQMTFNTSSTQVPFSAPALTQSMKNDYAAIPPGIFPHTCSLCYRQCSDIQDWMFHQNTSVHLRNCKQLRETYLHQLDGVDTKSRYESNSTSESLSGRKQHDRAHSPHRSRYHYRSRSRSPKYDASSSSRRGTDSRSPEMRSRKSDRKRSASRSSDERRSPRKSHRKKSARRRKRERRSSVEESSPEKERESSVERLTKKILGTPDDSSDLDAVVKALVPTLMAELAKMRPSSSSAVERRYPPTTSSSSSTLNREAVAGISEERPSLQPKEAVGVVEKQEDAQKLRSLESRGVNGVPPEAVKAKNAQPPTSSRETQLMEKQVQQQTSGDPQASKVYTRSPNNVSGMQVFAKQQPASSAGIYTFTVGEIFDKLLDLEKIGSQCFGLRSVHKLPRSGHRQLVITKLPQYCPGSYTEDDIAKLLSPFGFQHTDDNIFLFPKACLGFALMPTPLSACEVVQAISNKPLELKEAKLTVRVLCPKEMMTPLGLYKKLMAMIKFPVSAEGQSVIFIKQMLQEEVSELREALTKFNGLRNFMPLLNKAFVEFETEQDADCFRNWCCLQKIQWSNKMFKLNASTPSKCEESKAAQSLTPVATGPLVTQPLTLGKKKLRRSSFIHCLADGTPLTPGEMIEMLLSVEKLGCLTENTRKSPQFSWRKDKQILITELPASVCYTEQEISKVLARFGIQFKEDNIYVIPQARMAFIQMNNDANVQKLIKSQKDDPVILQGAKLCFHMLTSCINMAPLEFYKSLMSIVDFQVTDNGTRTIYIKNISQSDTADLREALKKIAGVRNFLPMLNRVFVEFDSNQDADRLGAWYSFQKWDRGHTVHRLKKPSSGCTAMPPRCPEDALPVTKDTTEGITLPTIPRQDFCLPPGTFGAFWITMRTRPYIFPTSSPWFIIPEYQTIRGQADIKTATDSQSLTVMLTNLPEENYKQEDFVSLVRPYFCDHNLQSLYYNMIVLPLQRRAFVFFEDKKKCCDFLLKHIKTPLLLLDQNQVWVHVVSGDMKPESTEVMMYRSLMKWSNAGAPDPDSLEERLLCVWISSVSVVLVRTVMKEVAAIAPFVNFLPLANRICIEMAEPSGVTKVLKKKKSFAYIAFGQIHVGSQILDIETVKDLKQRLSASVSTNLIPGTGSQSAIQASRPDESINPTSEGPSPSGTSDEAKTKEVEKPVPMASSAAFNVDKDVKRIKVEETSPKTSVPATDPTPAVAQASWSKHTQDMGNDDFTDDSVPSRFLFSQKKQQGNSVTATKGHVHEGHKPHHPPNSSSQMKDSSKPSCTKPVPLSCASMSSSSPVGTKTLPSLDRNLEESNTNSPVKSSNIASSCSSSSAQETGELKPQATVKASVESQPEQLEEEPTEADRSLVKSGCIEGTFKPDTKAETQTQSKGDKEESGVHKTDGETNEGGKDNTSKTQSAGPEDPQTVHQECFENSVEAKVQTDSELGPDGSLQGKDSRIFQDDGKTNKEGGDETKSKEEGVGKRIAMASYKACDDESKISNKELKLQESSNILKDLDNNVTTKGSSETVDFNDNKTAAEDQASDKQLLKDNDSKIEEDINRIVHSVEEPPTTTKSETNKAVELEDPARQGGRSSRRRSQTVKASKSDEKKNSPKIQDKKDVILDRSATQEAVIDEVDSVEDVRNDATKESSGRRSTRGKKGSEVKTHPPEASKRPDNNEETTVQLLDSVKDQTFSDGPTITEGSSRRRGERVMIDTSVEAQAPHTETTPTDRSTGVEGDLTEEVPTNEMLDSVEDKALKDGNTLNQERTSLTLDEAGAGEKSEEKQGEKTLRVTKRKNDDDAVTGKRRQDFHETGAKKSRSQSPSVPAHSKLPEFKPNNPLGLEFVVPKSGYFCNLCSIFFLNERSAKGPHCSSQKHYNNLKAYYQELKERSSEGSSQSV